ncbi:FapA family protein [Psychromonas sp. MME2]|uniref:DUF342 domain-containing protein n=1 Tax=unclassified Psychromonas TaxID=2614957 RepID=UPI00339C6BFD
MGENIIANSNLLKLSSDNKELLFLIQSSNDAITAEHLTQLILSSPYCNFKLDQVAINQAVTVVKQLKAGHSVDTKSIIVAERIDAQLSITIDPMLMFAKAEIISAYGGKAITKSDLKDHINELGIQHGIRHKTIELLIEKSQSAPPGTAVQATIAQGSEAVNGVNASFTRLVDTPKERLLKPIEDEHGRVDMRDLGELITVAPDSHLMRKTPMILGSPGMNVMGDILEYVPGKDFALIAGANTQISPSDENLLISTLVGIPKALGNGMQVDDVLLIDNVNVGYGHVNYDGSIIIKGNVCEGMKVSSSGDITVSGYVESAEINCGGDLIVSKGIIGRKQEENCDNYSCQITAKGSVIANFSQYSQIKAGESVFIKKQLLHCHVDSQGDINVIDESGLKGTILGGILRCQKSINTVTLGATAGSKTIIDLVGIYPKIINDRQLIKQCIDEEQSKLESLISAQRKIDILPNSEKKQELDSRLQLTKASVKEVISSLIIELESKNRELQQYFEEAKVIIQKKLHNDVIVSIGRDNFRSQRDYGPSKISVKSYKLSVEPYLK